MCHLVSTSSKAFCTECWQTGCENAIHDNPYICNRAIFESTSFALWNSFWQSFTSHYPRNVLVNIYDTALRVLSESLSAQCFGKYNDTRLRVIILAFGGWATPLISWLGIGCAWTYTMEKLVFIQRYVFFLINKFIIYIKFNSYIFIIW